MRVYIYMYIHVCVIYIYILLALKWHPRAIFQLTSVHSMTTKWLRPVNFQWTFDAYKWHVFISLFFFFLFFIFPPFYPSFSPLSLFIYLYLSFLPSFSFQIFARLFLVAETRWIVVVVIIVLVVVARTLLTRISRVSSLKMCTD